MVKQRGSALGLLILYTFFKIFGYPGLRLILLFVVFYFTLTSPEVKHSLRKYYLLSTGKFNFLVYYRHLFHYALVLSDRFLTARFPERYHVDVPDIETYLKLKSQGVIFLFSHAGDWTTCALIPDDKVDTIHIVKHETMEESIQEFEHEMQQKSGNHLKVIDLSEGPHAVAIKIATALGKKENVAMMADRVVNPKKSSPVTLFGQNVHINKNPFEIAYNRDLPLIAIFSFRQQDYRYRLHVHEISRFDRTLPKETAIADAAQEYATLLENLLREHPKEWFNHYDFFASTTS